MKSPKECIVDVNMVAIYVMIKADPGIKRARLYKNRHGAEVFQRMVDAGLIAIGPEHKGCILTEAGERFGLYLKEIVAVMGEEEVVQAYIDGLVKWYQDKVDVNRDRAWKEGVCPGIVDDLR